MGARPINCAGSGRTPPRYANFFFSVKPRCNLPREKRGGLPRERTRICCTCEIHERLSNFRSHGVKKQFLKQELVIKMRKCTIYVRT